MFRVELRITHIKTGRKILAEVFTTVLQQHIVDDKISLFCKKWKEAKALLNEKPIERSL